jgi:hypothetical protein
MVHTPRQQREERAMRGYWGRFPVFPDEYAGALDRQYKTSGWYSEDESFGLSRMLSAFVRKDDARASLPQLFALYRAFLTVVIEKMGYVDDSYGVIGETYGSVFGKYVRLDWRELDMPPSVFFEDLIELIIWEDYAFTWKRERPFLASIPPTQVPSVESILQEQWDELGALGLEYKSEEA